MKFIKPAIALSLASLALAAPLNQPRHDVGGEGLTPSVPTSGPTSGLPRVGAPPGVGGVVGGLPGVGGVVGGLPGVGSVVGGLPGVGGAVGGRPGVGGVVGGLPGVGGVVGGLPGVGSIIGGLPAVIPGSKDIHQ